MNEVQLFNFENHEVRSLLINSEPWFVGKDVADVLGYKNQNDALSKHVDGEDKDTIAIRDSIGRNRNTPIINESGLYCLVLSSKLPSAKKGKDSINNGIQWIQDLEIIIHPRCVNFITEISNYTWDTDKFGTRLNVPIDDFNHLMDAMRYALERYITKPDWLI